MSFVMAESKDRGSVTLDGKITVEHIAGFRQRLLTLYRGAGRLNITIGPNVLADLSFLQVLWSAYRTALQERKEFRLDCSASPTVAAMLRDAGIMTGKGMLCTTNETRETGQGGSDA